MLTSVIPPRPRLLEGAVEDIHRIEGAHFRLDRRRSVRAAYFPEVRMRADQSGKEDLSGDIDDFRARRHGHLSASSDRRDGVPRHDHHAVLDVRRSDRNEARPHVGPHHGLGGLPKAKGKHEHNPECSEGNERAGEPKHSPLLADGHARGDSEIPFWKARPPKPAHGQPQTAAHCGAEGLRRRVDP
jgi:hypothetical protein